MLAGQNEMMQDCRPCRQTVSLRQMPRDSLHSYSVDARKLKRKLANL